jgi:tetratricopeptide (TPR) repeat protein
VRSRSLLCILAAAFLYACSAPDSSAPHKSAPTPQLSEAELDSRITAGRALLEAGRPVEAEAVFAAAAAADGESLRTRAWVLRAWMDQGRSNDTLDALDALDHAGETGADMAYLYGMAFARRAEGYVADGVGDSSVRMNFVSAVEFLERAVQADPVRYRDAYLPLAGAAWYVEQPELARSAADRAVEVAPAAAPAWLLRGRLALAQFAEAERSEPGSAVSEREWSEAVRSFQRALELFGAPADAREQAQLADAATQLGHALLWRKRGPEATDAYATAIAWEPLAFPYAQAVEFLRDVKPAPDDERPCGFRAALELGRTRLETRVGADDPRAGTLLWFLGWARFVDADWRAAEEAFLGALARGPQYTNAWFYVGLARQYLRDSEGALAAMHAGWDADPTSMVAVVAGAGGSQRAFENLLGWCAEQEPPRNLDAAFLAEMLAEAMPDEARHWNNLGLFLRDEGERLEVDAHRNETPAPDRAVLDELYARSFRAYERALELTPDDPQLLNDTALMLIYHVGPDFPRAQGMFERAIALIGERLAQPGLAEEDRLRFEQSKADAEENLKRILDHLAGEDADPAADGAIPVDDGKGDGESAEASASGDG